MNQQSVDINDERKTIAILRDVNCLGIAISPAAKRFDAMYADNAVAFQTEFDHGLVEPANVFVFDRGVEVMPRFIFNAPVKIHWKAPVKPGYLKLCIENVVELCVVHRVHRLEIHEFDQTSSPIESSPSLSWQQIKLEFLTSFARIPDIKLRFVKPSDSSQPPKQVTVFTDGGAEPNPGVGGFGILLRFGNVEKELSQGYRLTTNNRMELLAATVALGSLKEHCDVRLYSDSRYIVDAVATSGAS